MESDVAHSLIGVDEVGRGCLAGPLLVVAARQTKNLPKDITDSKLLSRIQREAFLHPLLDSCEFGEGWVDVSEIDKYGLAKALRLGVKRALAAIRAQIDDEITLDGSVNYAPLKFIKANCGIGADFYVPIVSAASVWGLNFSDIRLVEID